MRMRALVIWLALVVGAVAAHASEGTASAPAEQTLVGARESLDFGDFEAVVRMLRPLAEAGGAGLTWKADRIEALRAYGIACALTGRRTAAEGAFVLLLEEAPDLRLDSTVVRPEAVSLFDSVRARFARRRDVAAAAVPAPPSRAPGIALVAGGAGLAAVALVFTGLTVQARNDYASTMIQRAADDAQRRFDTYQAVAISFGVGALAAGAVGTALWVRAARHR